MTRFLLSCTLILTICACIRPAMAQVPFEVLHTFNEGEALGVQSGLVQGLDGAFYGTSYLGGTFHRGTIFRMTFDGSVTVLHSFSGPDGGEPIAGLILASDGNFYGTASRGGLSEFGPGTVFRMTPAGAVTVLHAFTDADGKGPVAALVQANDLDLYGTTELGGGPVGGGTVFRISLGGAFQVVQRFGYGFAGWTPRGALVRGLDGDPNLYGTTPSLYNGPLSSDQKSYGGTVFSIAPNGVLTVLHAFAADTRGPDTTLVQGRDGSLYGTTAGGKNNAPGMFWRIKPDRTFTATVFPANADGLSAIGQVLSGLVQGTDGRFFGTTVNAVFQVTPLGSTSVIHTFNVSFGGSWPFGGLLQATDGMLYGTTQQGGAGNNSIAYRLAPPLNRAPIALADSVVVGVAQPVTIAVLANDSDPDQDAIGLASVTSPAHGSAVRNVDGSITYTPLASFIGTDTFSYAVTDGMAAPVLALVTVTVRGTQPVNHPPIAVDDNAFILAGEPVTIDVVSNDSDLDGDHLRIVQITQPARGTAVLNASNRITYTPPAGFSGLDTFVYAVTDGFVSVSASVFVNIKAAKPPSPPIAQDGPGSAGFTCGTAKYDFFGSTHLPTLIRKGDYACTTLLSNRAVRDLLLVAVEEGLPLTVVFAKQISHVLVSHAVDKAEEKLYDRVGAFVLEKIAASLDTGLRAASVPFEGADLVLRQIVPVTVEFILFQLALNNACVQMDWTVKDHHFDMDWNLVYSPAGVENPGNETFAREWDRKQKTLGGDTFTEHTMNLSCTATGQVRVSPGAAGSVYTNASSVVIK